MKHVLNQVGWRMDAGLLPMAESDEERRAIERLEKAEGRPKDLRIVSAMFARRREREQRGKAS